MKLSALFYRLAWGSFAALAATHAGSAAAQAGSSDDLDLPSLEALLNADVTTAARRSQKLGEAAAAVFVITRDDMRRAGVLHLPDAMRMVPGMQVGRISGDAWAVSARGFVGFSANKLLVLIDGRSVYDTLFSGVQWNTHDLPLDEIERIEVIRGPGASLWGANAVNGVVNIITRSSMDTRGGTASVTAGSPGLGQLGARYGGVFAGGGTWRVFAHAGTEQPMAPGAGIGEDTWQNARIGGRLDQPLAGGSLMVTADIQSSRNEQPTALGKLKSSMDGGHLLLRREWRGADGPVTMLQASLDRLDNSQAAFRIVRDTFQLDLQQQRVPWTGHNLVWGGGVKVSRDDMTRETLIGLDPSSETQRYAHLFVQDEIALGQRLHLTLGSKFEHNSYVGWKAQPTVRLAWQLAPQQMLWGAASRAVRTPSRAERGMSMNPLMAVVPAGSPLLGAPLPPGFAGLANALQPNPSFEAEQLETFELGWRGQLGSTASIDISLYRSLYDKLRYGTFGTPLGVVPTPAGPLLVLPLAMVNGPAAVSHGVEAALEWRPAPWWRLQAAYSQQHVRVLTDYPVVMDTPETGAATAMPRYQFSLRSGFDLPQQVKFDFWVRHVAALPLIDVPAYTGIDARLAWRARRDLELSLVGQNLNQAEHPEAFTEFFTSQARDVRRSAYLQMRLWF